MNQRTPAVTLKACGNVNAIIVYEMAKELRNVKNSQNRKLTVNVYRINKRNIITVQHSIEPIKICVKLRRKLRNDLTLKRYILKRKICN